MIPTAQSEVDAVLQGGQSKSESGFNPDIKFESRIQAAVRESEAKVAAILAQQEEADAKGELWTVQAAMYPKRAFCMIYHGRVEDVEPLQSQHGAAGAIFGPVYVTGKQREAMAEALSFFTVDEITIRVIRSTGISA